MIKHCFRWTHLLFFSHYRAPEFPRQKRSCWSMSSGLVLGCLLTSLVMILYHLPAQPAILQQQVMAPFFCENHPARTSGLPVSNASQKVPGRAGECTPKVNVMFMKTHKTASSTLLNILFRFGERRRLRFAFPKNRNDFFYPKPFHRSQVNGNQPGMCFNILCNHMRFSEPEVMSLLPTDAAYVTILRDPVTLFESSFHYYSSLVPLTWLIPSRDKIATFLQDPGHYFSPESYNSFYLKNLLFFDFGYDNTLDPDDPRVDSAIKAIAKRFQLVMLTEHFEESLILLRGALCWELEDLLFFRLNARRESAVSRLTPQQRLQVQEWNGIDWRLYRHFNATFWEKVEAYGRERMARDVAELRRRNAEMAAACLEGGRAVDASSIQEKELQPWQPLGEKSILGYNLRKDIDPRFSQLCRKMLTPEIQYMSQLGVNLWVTKLWGQVKDILSW